jgi:branched-chain amino acid transport system permease protein
MINPKKIMNDKIVFAVALIVIIAAPFVLKDGYAMNVAVLILMWFIAGQSWNLLAGYLGQVSFGHAAFFGFGAYATALLFTGAGVSPWIAMVIGGLLSAVISIPIGMITFRLSGPYFSLSTLAFAEILRLIFLNWREFTGGAVGILYPPIETNPYIPYIVISSIALIMSVGLWKLFKVKIGYNFFAIREDEEVASSLGINCNGNKLIGLFISAMLMGLCGGFYANYQQFIDPMAVFDPMGISLPPLVVTMVGGLGTLIGPLIGSIVVVIGLEVLRNVFTFAHNLYYGMLICAVLLLMPQGIVPLINDFYKVKIAQIIADRKQPILQGD